MTVETPKQSTEKQDDDSSPESIVALAKKRYKLAGEAWDKVNKLALEDLKF